MQPFPPQVPDGGGAKISSAAGNPFSLFNFNLLDSSPQGTNQNTGTLCLSRPVFLDSKAVGTCERVLQWPAPTVRGDQRENNVWKVWKKLSLGEILPITRWVQL